jgi:hypothetical protein
MNIRYVAQDQEWTIAMKNSVDDKIIEPLRRCLRTDNFDISFHFQMARKRLQGRKPEFEFWLVLQTFDGRNLEVVRCQGPEFYPLVTEASALLRERVRKTSSMRRRFFANPFSAPARPAVGAV